MSFAAAASNSTNCSDNADPRAPRLMSYNGAAGWSSLVARRAQSARSEMNTKHKGDIAEQAAILNALKRGWGALKPLGDNLPYDLVFDIGGRLLKVQAKSACLDIPSQNYV